MYTKTRRKDEYIIMLFLQATCDGGAQFVDFRTSSNAL